MQRLDEGPRTGLARDAVLARLTSPSPAWEGGAELLDSNLRVVADISDQLEGGSVRRVMLADIHGTCSFTLRRALSWGTDLVRLYTTVYDRPINPTVSVRFNLGVYALTTPTRTLGQQVVAWDVTGYDRLYLLRRAIGDTYAVDAGTGYLAAVRAAMVASGISASTVLLDGSAQAATLPQAMTWPLVQPADTSMESDQGAVAAGTTWLRVINDLLSAVGYRGLWCDQDGLFRSEPYLSPAQRASEWTFTVGGLVQEISAAQEATVEQDDWATPNRWVFVRRGMTDAVPAEGAGVYTVTDLGGVQRRGLVWPVLVELDAANQAALVTQGDARVASDMRVATRVTREFRPLPVMGHADVVTLVDAELGGTFRAQVSHWEQGLFGEDMKLVMNVLQG